LEGVQDGDDLVHCVGHPVVELLVRLPGGPLAVVVVFGGHPQQLVLGLGGALLGGVQLGLQGLGLAVFLVEPAVLLFGLVSGVAGGLRGPGGVGPGAGEADCSAAVSSLPVWAPAGPEVSASGAFLVSSLICAPP